MKNAAEIDSSLPELEQLDLLSKAIELTPADLIHIEESTRLQCKSAMWFEQRCARITASNIKRVYTRAVTLKNDSTKDPSAILKHVMGYKKDKLTTYAIKHGIATEPHAKRQYTYIQQPHHKKLTVHETGLHVHPKHSYLAASPDLIVNCACHGKGCVEIKCPWLCRSETPTHVNWNHLKLNVSGSTLDKNSLYYYQVQGQLAVTGLSYCDLFIYTNNEHHLERIYIDYQFWDSVFPYLEYFWLTHMRPEILSNSLKNNGPIKSEIGDRSCQDHQYYTTEPSARTLPTTSATPDKELPLTKPIYPLIFLCAICNKPCVDDAVNVGDMSIECTRCSIWVHFSCGGVDSLNLPSEHEAWYCDICI